MPIVTVEVVAELHQAPERNLAQALANAIGRALGSSAGHTWVRLRWVARHEYAENESTLSANQLPVFVTIVKRQTPSAAELHAEVATVTSAVASVVGRANACVHVEYAPSAAGRLAFGGQIVQ